MDPVHRGAGFLGNITDAATASRRTCDPYHRMIDIGFREGLISQSKPTPAK